MTDTIQDITRLPDGSERLTQSELAKLHALGITISDTETTGLQRGKAGLTEFASIRSVKDTDSGTFKLELLHHFILPLRPEYQDYLDACSDYEDIMSHYKEACAQARRQHKPKPPAPKPPPYDREQYEYQINPHALAVTGTSFLRETLDGPIIGMCVMGRYYMAAGKEHLAPAPASGTASAFHEVLPAIERFTHSGLHDVYYNTPFDKPFLSELIKDCRAYELAASNSHLADHSSADDDEFGQDEEAEHVMEAVRRHAPYLSQIPYEAAYPGERRELIATIRSAIESDVTYGNSAQYQCLLYSFMKSAGIGESHRLDDAYRKKVDPDYTGRAEHSAIEDICMAAQVAAVLGDDFGGKIPTMLELFGMLAQRVDPDATVYAPPPRREKANGSTEDHWIAGDIGIRFSKPLTQLGPQGARLLAFFEAFETAVKRNSRAPVHLLKLDPSGQDVIINAERKQPLSLNFLKKWMVFDQLQNHPAIEGFYPHSSTGTRIDIALQQTDPATGKPIIIEDTHYGSMRANMDFLAQHPDHAAECLQLIKTIRDLDRRIGVVLLREKADHSGYQMILKGHLRQLGDVRIDLPQEHPFSLAHSGALRQMERLLRLGIIPFVESVEHADDPDSALGADDAEMDLQSAADDESAGDESRKPVSAPAASLSMEHDHLSMQLDTLMMQLVAQQLHQPTDYLAAHGSIRTRHHRMITVNWDAKTERYRLSGDMDAFWDFIHPDAAAADEPQLTDKLSNLIANASWMRYRLLQIPGTSSLRFDPPMVILEQPDGVSLDAVQLLRQCGIPCKIYDRSIKLDAQQLMQDAFHWSQQLSRTQKDIAKDKDRKPDERELPCPPFLSKAQQALYQGSAQAMEIDDLRQCWLLDGTVAPQSASDSRRHKMRHYRLDEKPQPQDHVQLKGKAIDVTNSPVDGQQRLRITQEPDGTRIIMSAVTHALWMASRESSDTNAPAITPLPDGQVSLIIPAKDRKMVKEIRHAADAVYALHKLTGRERLPMPSIRITAGQKLMLQMPEVSLLEHTSLLGEMMKLHQLMTQGGFDAELRSLKRGIPATQHLDARREDLWLLCDRLVKQTTAIDAINSQLITLLKATSGYEGDSNRALNYVGRTAQDLGHLGVLIHELSSDINEYTLQHISDVRLKGDMRDQLQSIHTVREKFFRYATASARMDEAMKVLSKALVGSGKNAHHSLKDQIAQCLLFLVDTQAMEQGDLSSDLSLAHSMKPYEDMLTSLLGQQADAITPALSHAYERRAYDVLSRMEQAGPAALELSRIARYLLSRAHADWSPPQVNAVISLYTRGTDEASLDASRRVLMRHFPLQPARKNQLTVDQLLAQRQMHYRNHIPLAEPPAKDMQDIEQRIQDAYRLRARHYLTLLGTPLDETQPEPDSTHEQRIEASARHCLEKCGLSTDDIESKIEKARHANIKTKPYLTAWKRIMQDAPDTARNIEQASLRVDMPGYEQQLRDALIEKWKKQQHTSEQRLTQPLSDPHAEFKQRSSLLRAMGKSLAEIHDLQMVKLHAVRDLAAAIIQLQHDPAQFAQLPDDISKQITPIISSIADKPEARGLSAAALATTLTYRDTLEQRMYDHAESLLAAKGILYHTDREAHRIEIPLSEIGKWMSPAAPQITPPEIPAIAESAPVQHVNYSDAIRYASHLQWQMQSHDLMLHLAVTPKSHPHPTTASLVLNCSEPATRSQQWFGSILTALAEHKADQGFRLHQQDGIWRFDMPASGLPLTMSLLSIADKLSQEPAFDQLTLDAQSRTLHIGLNAPASIAQRDAVEGTVELSTIGMPVRLTTLSPLFRAKAGEHCTISIQMDNALEQGTAPAVRNATRDDVVQAARAYAKQQQMPIAQRVSMTDRLRSQDGSVSPLELLIKGNRSGHYSYIEEILKSRTTKRNDPPQR